MIETEAMRCSICGSVIDYKLDEERYVCEQCGHINFNVDNNTRIDLRTAHNEMIKYNFEAADEIYYNLSETNRNNPKVYVMAEWGRLLAHFGIVYILDFDSKTMIPTFTNYDPNVTNITDLDYYKNIMKSNIEDNIKKEYERKAKELNNTYKFIKEELDKTPEYDIFICTKVSARTRNNPDVEGKAKEYEKAFELYYKNIIGELKLKPFFSEIDLDKGNNYDSQILSALLRSKNMLIITSDKEYLESPWVQSEWRRWLKLRELKIKEDNSLLIYVLPEYNLSSNTLPRVLSRIQRCEDRHDIIIELEKRKIGDTKTTTTKPKEIITPKEEKPEKIKEPSLEYDKNEFDIENGVLKKYKGNKKEVAVPEGVISIGEFAFHFCSSITSISIPNSVTSIENHAFSFCSSLTSVTIPNSVTSIGGYAFKGCSSLTNFTIHNSVTSIGWRAFEGCSNLTSISIPNSVTSINSGAFSGCDSLKYNEYENGLYLGNKENPYLFLAGVLDKNITSFVINKQTKFIGDFAFGNCSNLTNITIPNSVTSIGWRAFEGCNSLKYNEYENGLYLGNKENPYLFLAGVLDKNITSFVINKQTKFIGDFAFEGCSKLTNISIPNSVISIGNLAFYKCTSLTNITIPNSVTSIENHAFSYCSSLTSIIIPNSVTSIGWWEFEGCSNLTSISIPNSVTSIGDYAFMECSSLTSIEIPKGVTSIKGYAFKGCSKLTSITIPNSVTSIEGHAFEGCSSLTNIAIPNSVTSIGWRAFEGCNNLTIYCEAESKPKEWHEEWNPNKMPVVWGYKK